MCVLSCISSTTQEKSTKSFEDERESIVLTELYFTSKLLLRSMIGTASPFVKVLVCNFVELCSLSSPKLFCILLERHVKRGTHLAVLGPLTKNLSAMCVLSCISSTTHEKSTKSFEGERKHSAHRVAFHLKKFC